MRVSGPHIVDNSGRVLLFRSNQEGSFALLSRRKLPEAFTPAEAAEHFEDLRRRGINLVRFVISWEALEHSEPGIYDEAGLAHVRKLLLEAGKKGISVVLAPCPGENGGNLTLEKLRLDLEFQERYIACFRHCYRRLKNCRALTGWEALDNPFRGPEGFTGDFLKSFSSRFFERMKEAERPAVFFVRGFPRGDEPENTYPWESLSWEKTCKAEGQEDDFRPYPMAIAGLPLEWGCKGALFRFRFRAESAIEAPTEMYAPPEWLGSEPVVTARGEAAGLLEAEYKIEERRIFIYNRGFKGEAEITAVPGGPEGSS